MHGVSAGVGILIATHWHIFHVRHVVTRRARRLDPRRALLIRARIGSWGGTARLSPGNAAEQEHRNQGDDMVTHPNVPPQSVNINPEAGEMFLQKRRFTAITEVITADGRLTVCVCRGWPLPCQFLPPFCEDSPLQSNSETAIFFPTIRCSDLFTIFTNGFAFEDHLALFELSHKIEISPFVVPPSLFPLARIAVENADTGCAPRDRGLTGEVFLHDATVQNALNVVRTVSDFTSFLSGPSSPLRQPRSPAASAVLERKDSAEPRLSTAVRRAREPRAVTERRHGGFLSCGWLTTSDIAGGKRSRRLATWRGF